MSKPKHILVIRMSAMGDVAMVVPVLRVLTQTYPDLKVTVVSRKFFKPLFSDISNVDFLEADVYGKHKGIMGLRRLAKEAHALGVDAVADLHNVLRSKIVSKFLKLKGIKVATQDKGRKEKKALVAAKNKKFMPLKTTHQRYADVFSRLGYPIDLNTHEAPERKQLAPKVTGMMGVEHRKFIGIAPFAAHEGKEYPLLSIKKLIAILDATNTYRIFLFGGGKSEEAKLNTLGKSFKNVINIAGKLTFEEELALISNLDLMVSMDSGNGHLAAMYGIPVLTLWGVTHPYAGFAPFNQPEAQQLTADRKKYPLIPTSIYGNKYPKGYEKAMETITPEMVMARISEII